MIIVKVCSPSAYPERETTSSSDSLPTPSAAPSTHPIPHPTRETEERGEGVGDEVEGAAEGVGSESDEETSGVRRGSDRRSCGGTEGEPSVARRARKTSEGPGPTPHHLPRPSVSLVTFGSRAWNGVERSGTEWNGVERSGTEWNGVERSGTEWNGVERSGTEWNGVERSGTEWNGVERSGTDEERDDETSNSQTDESWPEFQPLVHP